MTTTTQKVSDIADNVAKNVNTQTEKINTILWTALDSRALNFSSPRNKNLGHDNFYRRPSSIHTFLDRSDVLVRRQL